MRHPLDPVTTDVGDVIKITPPAGTEEPGTVSLNIKSDTGRVPTRHATLTIDEAILLRDMLAAWISLAAPDEPDTGDPLATVMRPYGVTFRGPEGTG